MPNPHRGALLFKAGAVAYHSIKNNGFAAEQIGTLVGASGGAKWLVLSQIDRVLLTELVPHLRGPVHLLGSSIGAWRFACYAQRDPVSAIERFEQAYLTQSFSDKPNTDEITGKSREILAEILGDTGVADILAHRTLRTNVVTVRSRHLLASESRPVLATGLLLAMAANAIGRRLLGGFFERAVFHDARDPAPFLSVDDFPMHRIPLSEANLADAITASGSIPMVLNGVRNIAGAPGGMYRDGGVIDYHLDLATAAAPRFSLFPHFFSLLKPGWFDRQLGWRTVNPVNFERTIVMCPSPDFIARLPGAKVPDRTDFVTYPQDERVRVWQSVLDSCVELADELNDVLANDRIPELVEPLFAACWAASNLW